MKGARPLSAFWFLYLGGLGMFFPYYSRYLHETAGLSGTQVGWVLSAIPLVGMLAQPFWGQVADRTGARTRVLAGVAFGAAAGQLLLFRAASFPEILLATVALALSATAVLPQAVAVSLAALPEHGARGFGRVRVWGTLGFLLVVVSFPRGLARLDGELAWMFPCTALLFAGGALAALAVPRGGQEALRADVGDWRALIRHRPVIALLALAVLAYGCLQGPMGLFPVFVGSRGGSLETVGNLWILMLLLEVPLVLYTGFVADRLGPRTLLVAGVVSGGIRWTVSGLSHEPWLVYGVQLLHGVTVAGLVIGGPLYLEASLPERLRSTAQASLAMVGVGIGGFASNLAAGWLLEHAGSDAPYVAGGVGALVCAGLMLALLPRPFRPEGEAA